MPSVKESETKQAIDRVSAGPAKMPDKPGADWDSLRGLTKGVQQQRRSANLRTATFALLLVLTFAFLGWVLHDRLPALVDFAEQVRGAVSTLIANQPKASTAAPDANDLSVRSARKKHRPFPARFADRERATDSLDEAYDPLSHPFVATAIVDGQRIPLVPNDRIVVVDFTHGTWKLESEPE